MKQLTQKLKNGNMKVLEVPFPAQTSNQILVQTIYSVISAGTEGRSVRDARANYVGKAKSRPKEFKQVLNTMRSQGVIGTYKIVMDKLNALSYLGYCLAGEVISIGDDVKGFNVGDLVACGGQGAAHAEVVSVLENLCVKIPKSVDIRHASFATIGSIAMQGIRQADNRLGESCLVIGLGLLGQFTIQMLNAAGIRTIGVDLDEEKVKLANKNGCQLSLTRNISGLVEQIMDFSGGYGVDSVIITAAANSTDPVNLGGEVCRMKGKVVSVGRVSTDFNRDTYYNKELDLRMSCSYGPGRYDTSYEEKGVDYPIGYVRWTENRNMMAYIELLQQKMINIEPLITHTFEFEKATSAYDMIMDGSEPFIGILLKYDTQQKLSPVYENNHVLRKAGEQNIGFVGAGNFAKSFLLPHIPKSANKVAVATATGHNARHVADKFAFELAYGNGDKVLNNADIDTVFIATRHNTHAEYVIKALNNQKHVFVEKPLCMTEDELHKIKEAYSKTNAHLMVGYNRRFSSLIEKIVDAFGHDTKKTINYRVNVGFVDPKHWTQDKEIGGGRIIGEVCHFLDLCMYLSGSTPKSISGFAMDDPLNIEDTVVSTIKFRNGTIATISYFTNGSKALEKEYLEVFCNGSVAVLNDYKKLSFYGDKKSTVKMTQDKGHKQELNEFIEAIHSGGNTPISPEEIFLSSQMTFDLIRSIREGKTINY